MHELNAVGDVLLRDPRAMRVLADPRRLELHDALRRRGPSSVAELAAALDAGPQSVADDLEALRGVDLVERRGETWEAVGRGFVFEIPDDDGERAARDLAATMLLQSVDLPRRWASEDEPRLSGEWARAAGLLSARMLVTPAELRRLQEELESILEPYLTRPEADSPDHATRVRVLAYFMPEADAR